MNEDYESVGKELDDLRKTIGWLKRELDKERQSVQSSVGKASLAAAKRRGDWLEALGRALGFGGRINSTNVDAALEKVTNLTRIASILGNDLNEAILRLDRLTSYERLVNEYEEGLAHEDVA